MRELAVKGMLFWQRRSMLRLVYVGNVDGLLVWAFEDV